VFDTIHVADEEMEDLPEGVEGFLLVRISQVTFLVSHSN